MTKQQYLQQPTSIKLPLRMLINLRSMLYNYAKLSLATKEDNNGYQPEVINPTGEIIRAMTRHGTFLVISRVVSDVIGTHHWVPLKGFLHPVKDIRRVPMAVLVLDSTIHHKIETAEEVYNEVMIQIG